MNKVKRLKDETYKGYTITFTSRNNNVDAYIRGVQLNFSPHAMGYGKVETFNKIKKVIDKIKSSKIKIAFYRWGQFDSVEEIDKKDLDGMIVLSSDDLLGFDLRSEDEDKFFYADKLDVEYSEDEGTGVKRSYATTLNIYR